MVQNYKVAAATPVFGIFEGGGAKGLAHIAALAAAEDNEIEFIGAAGASAGAIVAALVAVGYKADDIYDPKYPAANILKRQGLDPLSLIGLVEWERFKKATDRWQTAIKRFAIFGLAAALIEQNFGSVLRKIRSSGGYFSTQKIKSAINQILRLQLYQHYSQFPELFNQEVPGEVCFKHISPLVNAGCCTLKIVVTDLTTESMLVLDSMNEEHGDVVVAEAVAASISIPFVFEPAQIPSYTKAPGHLFADGGMVSNLPAWVFEEEKLNFERQNLPNGKVSIIAFSLSPYSETSNRLSSVKAGNFNFGDVVASTGRAAVFGGQRQVNEFISDLITVDMSVDLNTTQFNLTYDNAREAYFQAKLQAGRQLKHHTQIRPDRAVEVMKYFQRKVHEAAHGMLSDDIKMRCLLFEPLGLLSFHVTQSIGTEQDADDRLVFGRHAVGVPQAYESRGPVLIDISAMRSDGLPRNMTKYEFALIKKDIETAICLPVFKDIDAWAVTPAQTRPQCLGVVAIDSNADLRHLFNNSTFMTQIAQLSVILAPLIEAVD